jgi:hypothetical protein
LVKEYAMRRKRLRILTWQVHGNYLYYLTQAPHEFYVVSKPGHPPGYGGRSGFLPWGGNVHDAPSDAVRDMKFDCVLFQTYKHYADDQHELLSPAQRHLPKIYLEHDPPQLHPTDTRHPVIDADVMLVHVSAFNQLMWDNGNTPSCVIEHGVIVPPGVAYVGDKACGVVVVNHLARRGRRLGADIYHDARAHVPLALVGMAAEEAAGGLGEVRNVDLPAFMAQYRFFFHPVRYTSLGLALIEAMMVGLPIVGLATTELATVIRNGVNGFINTRLDPLLQAMRHLLDEPREARALGDAARRYANERFHIGRFVDDWNRTFTAVTQ